MKRIVCPSTQRIVDDGTVIPAGTPHYETAEVADRLIAAKLAAEAPEERAAGGDDLATEPAGDDGFGGTPDE